MFTNRNEQGRGSAPSDESKPQAPPRIRIDVPMGTSYLEIQESIFRQARQFAGTQLRAAITLGVTPDTISRVLRRCDRMRIACPKVPEAWSVITLPEPPPEINRAMGPLDHRAIDGENLKPSLKIPGKQIDRVIGPLGERQQKPNIGSTNMGGA
ncbi:MAG: hypothetical protein ABSG32_27160 [Terriglobia bacterium]